MEEDEIKRPGIMKRLAGSVGRSVANFDRKTRAKVAANKTRRVPVNHKKPNRFPKRTGAPLYDDEYGVLMNNDNKRKLGINPKW